LEKQEQMIDFAWLHDMLIELGPRWKIMRSEIEQLLKSQNVYAGSDKRVSYKKLASHGFMLC